MAIIDNSNKEFLNDIKHTAFYVTLQNMISSSLSLVDVVMLGALGGNSINGPGLAGQFFMIYILALFGFANGGQIFLSQFYGDKNMKNFHKAMGVVFVGSAIIASVFFIAAFFFPEHIMSLYSQDIDVIAKGSRYLKIISVNIPLFLFIITLSAASRSSGDAKLPMVVSSISLVGNTVLNYLLIYGNFGFPKLGYIGAAYATVISCTIAVIINISTIVIRKDVIYAKVRDYFDFSFVFFKKISIKSLPVFLNEVLWALGFSLYGMAFSTYSTVAYTSYMIFNVINNIMHSFGIGLAIANSVVLGNLLGAGEIKKAKVYERKFTKFQIKISIISSLGLVLLASFIPELFNATESVRKDAFYMLVVEAAFIPFVFYTMLHLVGTLRSGADIKVAVLIDLLTMYLIGVPLAFVSLHVLHLPLWAAQMLIMSEEVFKTILCYFRLRTGKWAKNLTKDDAFM